MQLFPMLLQRVPSLHPGPTYLTEEFIIVPAVCRIFRGWRIVVYFLCICTGMPIIVSFFSPLTFFHNMYGIMIKSNAFSFFLPHRRTVECRCAL